MENSSNPGQKQNAMPSPLTNPKKLRLATSTISPHLLQSVEQPDVLTLLHTCPEVSTILKPDGEPTTGRLAELQLHQNEGTSLYQASCWDPSTDHLYLPFPLSCDSPVLQDSISIMDGAEAKSNETIWTIAEAPGRIEDDATIDSLMDEYLHSSPFSTPDSAENAHAQNLRFLW